MKRHVIYAAFGVLAAFSSTTYSDTTPCTWVGAGGSYSIYDSSNWDDTSLDYAQLFESGTAVPYFSQSGAVVWFPGVAKFYGMRLKAPTGTAAGGGLSLLKSPDAGNAEIVLYAGGLTMEDGTSSTAANKRTHVIEPPLSAYQSQTWKIDTASTVVLSNGFSDGGVHGVTIQKTGKGTLVLDGTSSISTGSAFVVPYGTANQGYIGITGTVHVAGAFAVSNGALTVSGHVAGEDGAINHAEAAANADGTLSFRQGASGTAAANRFTLAGVQLDLPVCVHPYSASGTMLYLVSGSENYMRGKFSVYTPTKGQLLTLYTQGGTITFEDQIIATNCIWKTQSVNGHVILENRRFAENGGNLFYVYSPTAGLTEFNTPYNTFLEPDYGGLTFDYNNGTAQFNVDLAVTNGTFRFNNITEANTYRSYCNLMSTSQRIDRLVGVHATSGDYPNYATLYGDGAWLEIAGNGLASTNGMVISNCVNIVKTGSADLLFCDHDLVHTGELNIKNGRVTFGQTSTWRTSRNVSVSGNGCLCLTVPEQLSRRTRLSLDDSWRLELADGVVQTVEAVTIQGKRLKEGILGNVNYNASVTLHDDRITGSGVIKVPWTKHVVAY